MSVSSLEEKIKAMEDKMKSMGNEIELLRSVHEIQNLASRYEYYHHTTTMDKTVELFALSQPDVSMSLPEGIWEGREKVEGMYKYILAERPEGSLMEHNLTTPLIEVAKDNHTAKAVWFSPGHETIPGLNPYAYWSWGRYAVDFIREDGKWKIWHWQFYPILRPRVGKSWLEEPDHIPMDHRFKECPPTREIVLETMYKPNMVMPMLPVPPDPYDTWDGVSTCESVKRYYDQEKKKIT